MSMILDWETPRGEANVILQKIELEFAPTDLDDYTAQQTVAGKFQLLNRAGDELASVELAADYPPGSTVDQVIVALHVRLQQTLEDVMVCAFQKARQLQDQQDQT